VLAGAGRLYRCIQRQKIGLVADVIDDIDDPADSLTVFPEAEHADSYLFYLTAQHLHSGYGRTDIF